MQKIIANTYSEQIRLINPAKPIKLYRNLRTGLFSVFQGTVKFHTKNLFLRDVTFLVNEKGRQRVLATRQKNVHSFVQGYLSNYLNYQISATGENDGWTYASSYVRYNPYEGPHFTTVSGGETGKPVQSALACMFSKEADKLRVYAKGIEFYEFAQNGEQSELDTQQSCAMIRQTVDTHLL